MYTYTKYPFPYISLSSPPQPKLQKNKENQALLINAALAGLSSPLPNCILHSTHDSKFRDRSNETDNNNNNNNIPLDAQYAMYISTPPTPIQPYIRPYIHVTLVHTCICISAIPFLNSKSVQYAHGAMLER